jgi:hypothetical protein
MSQINWKFKAASWDFSLCDSRYPDQELLIRQKIHIPERRASKDWHSHPSKSKQDSIQIAQCCQIIMFTKKKSYTLPIPYICNTSPN